MKVKDIRQRAINRNTDRFNEHSVNYQIAAIEDALEEEWHIECTYCCHNYGEFGVKEDVAKQLHKEGWRDKYGHTLCPSCANLTEEQIANGEEA